MPQHLPHVFPQIARSKNEEQLLQGLSPERLQEASRTHSAIRYWTCCPPGGVFQMRSVEVLRWKVVRWRQLQPTHYSFMALIYWTDRDTENTNKHKTKLLPWQNGNFDHQGTNRAGAHVPQLQWERQVFKSLPSSLQFQCLLALCHISSCW